jgi:hypothetical protein
MFKDKPYKVSGKKFGPPPKRGPNPQGLSKGSKKEVKVKQVIIKCLMAAL